MKSNRGVDMYANIVDLGSGTDTASGAVSSGLGSQSIADILVYMKIFSALAASAYKKC